MKKLFLLTLATLLGISMAFAQTGDLRVTVLAGDAPVVGAMVNVLGYGQGHQRPHFDGITNLEGQIFFPAIPAIGYSVTAGIPGVPPVRADVEVLPGQLAEVTLTLPVFEPAPRIFLMPDHVFFGPVGIGTTFTRIVRVENRGTADLNVSLSVTGAAFALNSPAEFTLTADPMNNGTEVLVTFTPTEIQLYEGLLTVTSNDPVHGVIVIPLAGHGANIITGSLSVDVVVTDSLGVTSPVEEARVRVSFIRDHGGPRPQHFVGLTDAEGNLLVNTLPVGIYNVNASKRGVGFASEVIEISEAQTTFVTLTLVAADSGEHGGGGGGGHHFEIVELAGTVSIITPDPLYPDRTFYALDVDADGAIDYRLNFGPPWYTPPSGAERPADGDEVTIVGALMSHGEAPIVHVHFLNGELWWEPRGGHDGEHGGDGGGRSEGFGCSDPLTWVEISGQVVDINVFGSVFLGIDRDMNGSADYVIDFGENFDLSNPVIPSLGQNVEVVGGMVPCLINNLEARWVVVYEVDGQFYRMPGDTEGLDPLEGMSVSPNPSLIPVSHLVATNYPNPFNPTTTIEFSTPVSGLVTLTVFDVLGRQVATLVNDNLSAGSYITTWNAASLPSGMYMYRITVNEQSLVNRMLLLK